MNRQGENVGRQDYKKMKSVNTRMIDEGREQGPRTQE
jgi:hypothetical protein